MLRRYPVPVSAGSALTGGNCIPPSVTFITYPPLPPHKKIVVIKQSKVTFDYVTKNKRSFLTAWYDRLSAIKKNTQGFIRRVFMMKLF